ncbi:hypothetical protein [Paraburkholderia sp. J41]|uniref:hypothetical protein n=1 Tax=Paraburkholderia sp. J41 TaxID=2805433 RepID=UPI002AC33603|nr:hypothetical protein [Paraburkholderia sp. J41]
MTGVSSRCGLAGSRAGSRVRGYTPVSNAHEIFVNVAVRNCSGVAVRFGFSFMQWRNDVTRVMSRGLSVRFRASVAAIKKRRTKIAVGEPMQSSRRSIASAAVYSPWEPMVLSGSFEPRAVSPANGGRPHGAIRISKSM